MGLELCKNCGWMHYTTDACREPKKSTAARKDVRGPSSSGRAPKPTPAIGNSPTGTQAPPVDTLIVGKRRGRPQTITDMKAYKAQKAKEYRAKAKQP